MERCDVLIVGGGPAGSSCAAKLRRGGADVIVLDKKQFPRVKPCAGWITPQVVVTLELDAVAYEAAGNVFQPLTGFRTGLMSGPEVETHYGCPVSYGILRRQFDHYLLQRLSCPGCGWASRSTALSGTASIGWSMAKSRPVC